MGILNNRANVTNRNHTKGFYFGAIEAEGENNKELNLVNYFEDYLNILSDLEVGKFIFVGRKGSGKSAIAKYIKDTSVEDNDMNASILRFSDFELEKIIQSTEVNIEQERFFFEWLILVGLVKQIVKNQDAKYTEEYRKLQKFLDANAGLVNVDKQEILEISQNKGGEVKFGVLTNSFGGVFKKYFGLKTTKAPFYKMISPLKEIIEIVLNFEVNQNKEYWILFDDLDINFIANNDNHNQRIIELIRIAKEYNNELFRNMNARIVIFLRNDIKKSVISKFPDSAKIFASYEIPIQWYNHDYFKINENSIPLKKLVNKRISLNFDNLKIDYNKCDAWTSLIKSDTIGDFNGKTSFKYIADFTFYRPRDFITFLSIIGTYNYAFPLSSFNLKRVLKKYIDKNVIEIKSELTLLFNEREKEILFKDLFPELVKNHNYSYDDFIKYVDQLGFKRNSCDVIDDLMMYNLVIYKDENGNLYFNYREDQNMDKAGNNVTLALPKCIYHYYNDRSL